MSKHYEIRWSLEFEAYQTLYNCKDEEDAVKKFNDIVGETLNDWSWDLAKDVEIKEIDLIKEKVDE